jgi:hypothetical protein
MSPRFTIKTGCDFEACVQKLRDAGLTVTLIRRDTVEHLDSNLPNDVTVIGKITMRDASREFIWFGGGDGKLDVEWNGSTGTKEAIDELLTALEVAFPRIERTNHLPREVKEKGSELAAQFGCLLVGLLLLAILYFGATGLLSFLGRLFD